MKHCKSSIIIRLWSQFWLFLSVLRCETNTLMHSVITLCRSAVVHLTVPLHGGEEEPSDISRETQTRWPPLRTGAQSASNDERGEVLCDCHSSSHLKLLSCRFISSLQIYWYQSICPMINGKKLNYRNAKYKKSCISGARLSWNVIRFYQVYWVSWKPVYNQFVCCSPDKITITGERREEKWFNAKLSELLLWF